ncbi:MAG TPA: di-heme oxidoredictase family protein [Thermoanaerobaculia bacterium]|nr:di-heme oxidoredictase family protein [Thermoanaerobaculia bacterium]
MLAITYLAGLGTSDLWPQVSQDASDPYGFAIAYPFVHLVHSSDIARPGTTGHLRAADPFLLYQLGHDLTTRKFTLAEGAYGREGELSVPLYVMSPLGVATPPPSRFARDHAASCGSCHSTPAREPGAGQTISSTAGMGRNTPHFYGAGLVEMIAEQTRQLIMNRFDLNHDGIIDRAEAQAGGPIRVAPVPGVPPIEYGDLRPDRNGVPQVNPVFRIRYFAPNGQLIADAQGLNDPRVAGFDLVMLPFGWGRGYQELPNGVRIPQGGESATLRGIFSLAADVHMGLQAFDPTQQPRGPDQVCHGSRLPASCGVSLSGATQFDFGEAADRGVHLLPSGLSADDPDHDGKLSELTEGDVDAAEFYMLHAPVPGYLATPRTNAGRRIMKQIGCMRCHVESWLVRGRDGELNLAGDRRLFRFEVHATPRAGGTPELRGTLIHSAGRDAHGGVEPRGAPYLVKGIFSDFKHWDIGPAFYELRYDGSIQREHRTAPLWGVGSTGPYGHAGQFLSLPEVILAHAGNAAPARRSYQSLSAAKRQLLIDFLASLVLYATDDIPADIDGDGVVSPSLLVLGQDVGRERFDPRFLFSVVPRFRFLYDVQDEQGRRRRLLLIDNVRQSYGLDLPYRRDDDGDGFPDVLGPPPGQTVRP